jgi:hypothetical protein
MDVKRHRSDPLDRPNDSRADSDVRNKVSVHDVDVKQIRATAFRRGDSGAEGGEVSG